MSFAEFISVTFPNASTELKPIPGAKADPDFIERYSRGLDDYDFNYTLIPCKSPSRSRSCSLCHLRCLWSCVRSWLVRRGCILIYGL